MQLRFLKTILQPGDGLQKVSALTWAPNNGKLAAVTNASDKVVYLFDDNGERRDKFKTKPADAAGSTTYVVRGMAFSPDSTKLAIAQSDNIVFVYRLGETWGDKKSICNKFIQQSAITCLVWPRTRDDVVFGLADGKVKLGMIREKDKNANNKAYTMYTHPEGSYVVAVAASPGGQLVISGHMDGSIYKFAFPSDDGTGQNHSMLAQHSCVPYALGWGYHIAAAGNDNRVVFYDLNGREVQVFDYSTDDTVREFTSCAFNPSGETVVFGTYNKFIIYTYNLMKNSWDQVAVKDVKDFYAVSALSWKPDGSKLCVGSMTGSVDVYDACVKRQRYRGKFEFTYVSKSSVIVKELKSGKRIVLKSVYGYDIERINIYQERYLIARTAETLLMGDLERCKLSEIQWQGDGSEKYIFDNETVCIVYWAGEMTIVAYGRNEVLGKCRTEHMHPTLMSVVAQEGMAQDRMGPGPESRVLAARFAYLIDLQTVRIMDLNTNVTLATINHDSRIDWLELNHRGTHLLFRDKKRHLNLYNLAKQERATLLNYTGYVQWVPGCDVVVAQSRNNLCIWYSINNPENMNQFPIKGDVVDIERNASHTEVIVEEGINTVSYALDNNLMATAQLLVVMDAMANMGNSASVFNFDEALRILEPLELTPETEAQWTELADKALQYNQVVIAERCFAAMGDIARARFLHKIVKAAQQAAQEFGGNGYDSYGVRSQLAMLGKQWPVAENLMLAQGKIDEAITMYTDAYKWEDAIRVSEQCRHPDTESLKQRYYKWLLETGQEEKAGMVKEREGDYLGAISLYLKGGLPARAALVVMQYGVAHDPALVDSILAALSKAGLHERAGELYDYLGRTSEALNALRRAHAYRKAIELAKRAFPAEVVVIEEEYGDWLMSQKQMDQASNHFIEAGASEKAIEAAIQARQFAKAAGIVDILEPHKAVQYYKRIAQHYESTNNLEEAERCFIRAGMAMEAVDMYSRAGKWDQAQKVARGYLRDDEMISFYRRKARDFEAAHKYKDAEKAYLQCNEVDSVIAMYKKARNYDQMIRIVTQHRKDQLGQAHMLVAQQLEAEGNLREAEKHYSDAKEWKAAVQMYRSHGLWEDALRVAKVFGGINASKQVAYAWAITLGGDEGASLLKKLGLLDQAIDYAVESGAFAQAFELTRAGAKQKLPEVHLKYAMFLEDEGKFTDAEEEFISAGKPREAIDMYIHAQEFDAAMRVAEQYDPPSVSDVLVAQARVAIERKQYQIAETLYIKAKRYELALKMYRDARMWHDALRVAEDYLPTKVQEIHMELASGSASAPLAMAGPDTIIAKARKFEQNNDYARAIETYLSISSSETNNLDMLEQCWEQAANLAINYQRHRMADVVATAAQKLIEIQRFQAAAELHEGIEDVQGAVRAYCAGQMWDKARALAGDNPTMNNFIETQHQAFLRQNQAADELATRGGQATLQAIEMFAQRDAWDKVHELAAQQGPEVSAMYAVKHAERRFKQGEYGAAAAVFAAHGVSPNAAYIELYRGIASGVLTAAMHERQTDAEKALKDMMFRVINVMGAAGSSIKKTDLEELRRTYLAAHYISSANASKQAGLRELAARQLTSALRYVGIIPADRAFYEAGMAWREAGQLNMAFVMFNRYLDLSDAMDEPDSSAAIIENADFADTDIPFDFHIPQRPYLAEDRKEEVRNFVLELSMDKGVEQTLTCRPCEFCGVPTYEANLSCHACKNKWEPCAVSGYPVQKYEKIVNRSNGFDVIAIRDMWNMWVTAFHTDPVTGQPAAPQY